MQAECRCRAQVNIGWRGVVDGDAKHLANLTCRDLETLRFVGQMLTARKLWRREADKAANHTVDIYYF